MMQLFKSLPIAGVFLLLRFQGHSTAKLKFGSEQFSLAVCPGQWTTHKDSCYILMEQNNTWSRAQRACKKFGGNLATIANPSENNILDALLPNLTSYMEKQAWIGLNDRVTEGTFVWLKSNREASWTNWDDGEPNNELEPEDCVAIMPGGHWNDAPCSVSLKFICELSA